MPTRLLLIDGLPGSGKSTLAARLGESLPSSIVWQEMDPANPLHAVAPGEKAAGFAGIIELAPDEVARLSLGRWQQLADSDTPGPQIFESYPFQSGVRLLLQVDASRDLIFSYATALESAIEPMEPRLIYLIGKDPRTDIDRIAKLRGPVWQDVVAKSLELAPWAVNRSLSGLNAALAFIEAYHDLTLELLNRSSIPRLEIPGGADFDEGTVRTSVSWLAGHPD